jgi:PTS system N-acetylglucosamine-specific IIC component
MVLMDVAGVRLGFGFSAGLFDYLLNFNIASRPLWLLPIGIAYGLIYYAMFRYFIVRFDLPTPGRDRAAVQTGVVPRSVDGNARLLIDALGGAGNLRSVDACTTRLRLVVADQSLVQTETLRQLGAHGVIQPTANAVQVVLGPIADQVASEMRSCLGSAGAEVETGREPSPPATHADPASRMPADRVRAWIEAFGGPTNLRSVECHAGRLRFEVVDRSAVDEGLERTLEIRALVWIRPTVAHVLVDPRIVDCRTAREQLAAGALRK